MIATFRDRLFLRRTMFLSVNLLACLVALTLVILPMRDLLGRRAAELDERRQLLARLEAIAAQAQTVQGLIDKVDATNAPVEFLRGTNPGVIAADLQTRLTAMIQSAGGRVRSIRSLPLKTTDGVKFIGAQIEMSGPHKAVNLAIHSIENATPYLFIAGATIKATQQQATLGGPGTPAAEPGLDAQLDVIGALRPEARD